MSGTPIVPSATDSPKKPNQIIAWVTGLLTLSMAGFAFTLSFTALSDLAAHHGVSIPVLFPLIVEAGVIIFSLNALHRSLQGESTTWQWCLIIGSSLMAGLFNVVHAEPTLISRIMAAMPSLFLLFSFETFLGQVKYAVRRREKLQSLDQLRTEVEQQRTTWEKESAAKRSELEDQIQKYRQEIERLQDEAITLRTEVTDLSEQRDVLKAELVRLRQEQNNLTPSDKANPNGTKNTRASKKRQAQEALLEFYTQFPNASLAEAGEAIERSKSTVSNYLNELTELGRIVQNGNSWEVQDGR